MSDAKTVPLGSLMLPLGFGDHVITSLLFNHDANPVHHKPDHAVQWMMGLLAGANLAEGDLAKAGAEERTYTMGTRLLERPDVVVMPGIILAAICYERFVPPEDLAVSVTTTFTYPLLVPTKGQVDVRLEAGEVAGKSGGNGKRQLVIEAFGPGLFGAPVRLLKMEVDCYAATSDPEAIYKEAVAPEFERLAKLEAQKPGMPGHSHPAAISQEDRRRYARIVGFDRRISPAAWQAKIPRVLTEIIELMENHEAYMAEVKTYHEGREDEAERRAAIARYVDKEIRYRHLGELERDGRIESLARMTQQLYARQHTVYDPRLFVKDGAATKPGVPLHLDLHLYEMRLRRGIHRFYTGARQGERQVFRGEATVTGQPLVTRELANFLCEVNHAFETLRLFTYRATP